MGIIKKLFSKNKEKTDEEIKAELLKKATDHWNANSEQTGFDEQNKLDSIVKKNMPAYEGNDQVKKKNIRAALLEIAERGEAGILAISISDKLGISQPDTSTALMYLTKNNYVEAVTSPAGKKYYLTQAGRKYCISKEFNSDV